MPAMTGVDRPACGRGGGGAPRPGADGRSAEAQTRRARLSGPDGRRRSRLSARRRRAREEDAAPLLHELAVQHQLGGRAPPERARPRRRPTSPTSRCARAARRRDYLPRARHLRRLRGRRLGRRLAGGPGGAALLPVPRGRRLRGVVPRPRGERGGRGAPGGGGAPRPAPPDRWAKASRLVRQPDGSWQYSAGARALAAGGAGTAPRPGQLGPGGGQRRAGDARRRHRAARSAAVRGGERPGRRAAAGARAAPGSGKTTVALHRLARLAAAEPELLPRSIAPRVVVPEEGLARLSAPAAGAARRRQRPACRPSTPAFLELARRVFGALAAHRRTTRRRWSRALKRHPALHDALHARLATRTGSGAPSWRRLRRELAEPAHRPDLPRGRGGAGRAARCRGPWWRRRCATPCCQLADPLAAIPGRHHRRGAEERGRRAVRWTRAPTTRWRARWTSRTCRCCSPSPLAGAAAAARGVAPGPRRGGGLLALRPRRSLAGLLPRAAAGHRGRRRGAADARPASPAGSARSPRWERPARPRIRLPVSYRCPRPIAELAQSILGALAPASAPRAAREGAPVGRFAFPGEPQAHLFLAGALRELLEAEPHAAVAVVCHDAATARRFSAVVAELPSSRLVLDGRFTFEPGLDVTDVDQVKGLEFDYVVVPDAVESAWPANDEGRRRLHVAVTRASWQLWLVSPGTPTRLLPPA